MACSIFLSSSEAGESGKLASAAGGGAVDCAATARAAGGGASTARFLAAGPCVITTTKPKTKALPWCRGLQPFPHAFKNTRRTRLALPRHQQASTHTQTKEKIKIKSKCDIVPEQVHPRYTAAFCCPPAEGTDVVHKSTTRILRWAQNLQGV